MQQGPDGDDPADRLGGPRTPQAAHLLKDGTQLDREGGRRQQPHQQPKEEEK
jgi:hypothetical protein